MKKIAVFASGGGTDFQSIIDANARENFCEIKYLVASKPNIGAITRATHAGITPIVYEKDRYDGIGAFYAHLADLFNEEGIDLIVLAGWLLIIPADFIAGFEDRIINIHPALIPSFCGKGMYGLRVHQAAIDYGVKVSGATVHFVSAEVDGGAIIMQTSVPVHPTDDAETLQARILKEEHIILPLCVKKFCEGKIKKTGRTVSVE
ncbi:MAG: phosphoribosylglycinamide formyltransferase [Clostridia bacterium]|nr:phosphoribosylglycinamide formyltransferase [Clostridia bacterium]